MARSFFQDNFESMIDNMIVGICFMEYKKA